MMLTAVLCVAGALTAAPAPPEAPPEKIVYTSASAEGKSAGLFIMNPDGSKPTSLSKEGVIEIDPSLSADGKRIVFVAVSKDDMKGDLWVMDADGGNRKQLTQNAAKTLVMSPTWSPDGKHIVFTRGTADSLLGPAENADLIVTDADGKNEKAVGKGMMPAWSPDGKQILCTQLAKMGGFEPRVALMDADGANAKQLVNIPSMMGAFSPDGKHIAFVGAQTTSGTTPRVYVANADGSQAVQVVKAAEGFEVSPHWSADGKRIYFSRMPKGGLPASKGKILVMDADGGNEKELTKGDGLDMLGGAAMFLLMRLR